MEGNMFWKILTILNHFVNNNISVRFGYWFYFKYLIDECYSCNKSGFEVGFENNITNCKH